MDMAQQVNNMIKIVKNYTIIYEFALVNSFMDDKCQKLSTGRVLAKATTEAFNKRHLIAKTLRELKDSPVTYDYVLVRYDIIHHWLRDRIVIQ